MIRKLLQIFRVWRRRPFKEAVIRAYSDRVLSSKQMHEICDRIDKAI